MEMVGFHLFPCFILLLKASCALSSGLPTLWNWGYGDPIDLGFGYQGTLAGLLLDPASLGALGPLQVPRLALGRCCSARLPWQPGDCCFPPSVMQIWMFWNKVLDKFHFLGRPSSIALVGGGCSMVKAGISHLDGRNVTAWSSLTAAVCCSRGRRSGATGCQRYAPRLARAPITCSSRRIQPPSEFCIGQTAPSNLPPHFLLCARKQKILGDFRSSVSESPEPGGKVPPRRQCNGSTPRQLHIFLKQENTH